MEGSTDASVSTMSNGGEEGYFWLSPSSAMKIQKGDITQWFVDGCSDAIVSLSHSLLSLEYNLFRWFYFVCPEHICGFELFV